MYIDNQPKNRLSSYGLGTLGLAPGMNLQEKPVALATLGYWGNSTTRMGTRGYSNRTPGGSGVWRWFPTQAQALLFAGSGSVMPPAPPGITPLIKPPPPPTAAGNWAIAAASKLATPLTQFGATTPPPALDAAQFYMWTKKFTVTNPFQMQWLWKFVAPPEAKPLILVPGQPPPADVLPVGVKVQAPINPVVKWYNKSTAEIRDARLLSAPDSSGNWILGSTAVAQGLISAGALYGIFSPGGGLSVTTAAESVQPVGSFMPAYPGGPTDAPVQAGFSLKSIPTWVWIAGGAAALFFMTRGKK